MLGTVIVIMDEISVFVLDGLLVLLRLVCMILLEEELGFVVAFVR